MVAAVTSTMASLDIIYILFIKKLYMTFIIELKFNF